MARRATLRVCDVVESDSDKRRRFMPLLEGLEAFCAQASCVASAGPTALEFAIA